MKQAYQKILLLRREHCWQLVSGKLDLKLQLIIWLLVYIMIKQTGGEINPMLPGVKIMAIFGFCDIKNFTDATEVLQTGVMLFVNEIAEITHGTVD